MGRYAALKQNKNKEYRALSEGRFLIANCRFNPPHLVLLLACAMPEVSVDITINVFSYIHTSA